MTRPLVFLLGFALGAIVVVAVLWLLASTLRLRVTLEGLPTSADPAPAQPAVPYARSNPPRRVLPTLAPVRAPNGTTGNAPAPTAPAAAVMPPSAATPASLLLPVAGIKASQLTDTFSQDRGGRVHEAIDIMAPRGTPVLAVADGRLAKLFDSRQGGLTIYQFDVGETHAFYYAHLDAYAPGLVEGAMLRRGEVIGTVGSTGNADPAGPHLHFAVFVLGKEKRWWEGSAINPHPLIGN
jgi:murein DD-endopeptidase MepM/ murein hydrolase activator NlpD